jgi:hypothetical protein
MPARDELLPVLTAILVLSSITDSSLVRLLKSLLQSLLQGLVERALYWKQ